MTRTNNKPLIISGALALLSCIFFAVGENMMDSYHDGRISISLYIAENVFYKLPFIISCFFLNGKTTAKILNCITFGYYILGRIITLMRQPNFSIYVIAAAVSVIAAVLIIICHFKNMKALSFTAVVIFALLFLYELWNFANIDVYNSALRNAFRMITLESVFFMLSVTVFSYFSLFRNRKKYERLSEYGILEKRLYDLKHLADNGDISPEDYAKRKKEIIDSLSDKI